MTRIWYGGIYCNETGFSPRFSLDKSPSLDAELIIGIEGSQTCLPQILDLADNLVWHYNQERKKSLITLIVF